MDQVIPVILSLLVLSFPIVFLWFYWREKNQRAKEIIQAYSDESSEVFADLTVWVKNFDVYNKKNLFDLDLYQNLYSFNDCDLILNDKNLIVVGKMNLLGIKQPLIPIVFEFDKKEAEFRRGSVSIKNIRDVGEDIEVEFLDNKYKSTMTLVIKRAAKELKDKMNIINLSGSNSD